MKNAKIWNSNTWISYTDFCYRRYRRYTRAFLREEDWEDIKQNLLQHIWIKKDLYKNNRPLKPWLKTVANRFIINELRNRISLPTVNLNKRSFVMNMRFPTIITAKYRRLSRSGEEVYYEPEIIDESLDSPAKVDTEHFLSLLKPLQVNILRGKMLGKDIKEISAENKMSGAWVYANLDKIKKTYIEYAQRMA